jgi:hypothetical protein
MNPGSGELTPTEAGYDFLAGADPYSDGVVAQPGYEIVHAVLRDPPPWRTAFEAMAKFLAERERPTSALCAVQLRSPEPRSFDGFAEFNASYLAVLDELGLRIDGRNPLARTNVAPSEQVPEQIIMPAFSFTLPSVSRIPTFVTAGSGELVQGELAERAIVAPGDLTPTGLRLKVGHVLRTMTSRLERLGVSWHDVTAIDVYTLADPAVVMETILPEIDAANRRGLRWLPSRPPLAGLDFEMDVRGVRQETMVGLANA